MPVPTADHREADIAEFQLDREALHALTREFDVRVQTRTAEAERQRDEALRASLAKSAFLAAMSHEIRTPMNGVLGMIEVLHQTSLKGYQVEMVDLIRDSAFSLLKVIDDILDFSKIEAGKLSLEAEPMQLGDAVERVCNMLDGMAAKRDVRLTTFVDPAIPHTLIGDEGRLRQVLINLASNAIKFSSGRERPGRVSVRAILVGHDANAAAIDLIVADDGIGMDEETQALLFTPFSQADASTTRRFGGTGLGLAISGMLVALLGGTISVRSAPGQGTSFTVHLRFAQAPDAVVPEAAPLPGFENLSCRIVGGELPLAEDFAAGLRHAGAFVDRSPDMAAAAAAQQAAGMWVWLLLPDQPTMALAEMRAAVPARPGVRNHFLVLGWGQRRRPRVDAVDLVNLDADVLFRSTLYRAVALACGLVRDDATSTELESDTVPGLTPTRHEAKQRGRLILVAEDNETNRKVILLQLQLIGYAADVVVNGLEALERWRSGDYALLLTDLHMPEMDGYALTAAIRAEEKKAGRRTPVIALTANVLRDEESRCRAAGMDAYLSKPVRLPALKEVIESWLTPGAAASAPQNPPPAQLASRSPVDLSVLVELVGGDATVIAEVLQAFRISAVHSRVEMEREITNGAVRAAADAAHKMRSAAQSIGAMRLAEICAEIETAADSGSADSLALPLLRFQTELAAVCRFLESR